MNDMKACESIFDRIIAPERLFAAWEEFRKGKQTRKDVEGFDWQLEQNIFALHRDLASGTYRHGPYSAFTIHDPKQRRIHKATVQDRILHHAVFAALNPLFEPTFIAHSFSCQKRKGTHRAVDAFDTMLRSVSRNGTRPCFALKCDVHRFFASVDHAILLRILGKRITDAQTIALLQEIVGSFVATSSGSERHGIPIGNLTSQLFANVYMNAFDQFIKHELRVQRYIRYTDDFIVVSGDESYLYELLPAIRSFLRQTLHLDLHPRKVTICKHRQGIDFLGYVLFPHYRLLRTKTRRRIFRKLHAKVERCRQSEEGRNSIQQSLQSYLGVLSHANTHHLSQELHNQCWFWMND